MIVEIPEFLIAFSKQYSGYKTPPKRTKGAPEAANQHRGDPDVLDTLATFLLWQVFVASPERLPATVFLTANTGDETDLRIQRKGGPAIDVNVKATRAHIPRTLSASEYGNVAIKAEELGVDVSNPLGVSITRDSSGRLCAESGSCRTPLPEVFVKVFVHPGHFGGRDCIYQPHIHLCNWIATDSNEFRGALDDFVRSCQDGRPHRIPGINHPGLWLPPSQTQRFKSLVPYLAGRL